ncbi:hypothetical protein [Actinomadura formosensis]|uniref:hypothetical protein n=1 Tax=Actinomadura formosensis TaxID=60706 RepID=UPI0008349E19|nr:hypothetical protein [Actinomadura formosensis]
MEEKFVLQKSLGHSGRVELTFVDGDLRHEDALFAHRYGQADGRDCLLKTAVSPTGTKVLRREADAYGRISGQHPAFGRLLGFQTAQDPVCLMVTRRGKPISRCDPALRFDAAELGRAARDLFGALAVLADLGFAHRAVSADSVFWDGVRIELQEFGHVEPLGPVEALHGSALGSPTGLPPGDAPDVLAAARLLHRLATGRAGGGTPAAMTQELARVDAGLAEALEPALHARPGHAPAPKEMADRLWRTSPKPPPPPAKATAAPPSVPDEQRAGDHPHRMEFRELRRQQREFRRRGRAVPEPVRPQRTGASHHGPQPEPAPPSGGGSTLWLLFGVLAVVIVVLVLVVR